MKKLVSLLCLALIIFLSGCQEDKITCKITIPHEGQSVLFSKDLIVTIDATSSKGHVPSVTVFYDTIEYAVLTSMPYKCIIPTQLLTLGEHKIKAGANCEGKVAVSSVTFNVVKSLNNDDKESPDFVTFSGGKLPDSWTTYTWEVVNTLGYDDNYSLKSAGQTATVYTTKTMKARGQVEFYTKLQNTQGGNIDLYIDNEKAQPLVHESGNWDKWVYVIEEGKHSLRWQTDGALKYLDAVKFSVK
jgi:hypothetical protein